MIGGTSLFGGRGTMKAALLGALVIGSIDNGLGLLGLVVGRRSSSSPAACCCWPSPSTRSRAGVARRAAGHEHEPLRGRPPLDGEHQPTPSSAAPASPSGRRGRRGRARATGERARGVRGRARDRAARTAPTRRCSRTRRSTRSTCRCRTRCTSRGRCRALEAGKHVLCEKPLTRRAGARRRRPSTPPSAPGAC